MNPMVKEIAGAILRWALTAVFAGLVTRGVVTQEQATYAVGGLVGLALTLLWVVWVKWGQRLKIVTALALDSGTTEHELEALIKRGAAPPATLAKSEAPYVSPMMSPPNGKP
jgi:hypothetical protein